MQKIHIFRLVIKSGRSEHSDTYGRHKRVGPPWFLPILHVLLFHPSHAIRSTIQIVSGLHFNVINENLLGLMLPGNYKYPP